MSLEGIWVRVASEDELAGGAIAVTVHGHRIALFGWEGEVFALDDVCSHEYARLSEGEIWDGEVTCPKHGSRFDLRTGAVKGLPATEPVRSYQVKVEGAEVYIRWSTER